MPIDWISLKDRTPAHRQKVLISDGYIVTAAQADLLEFGNEESIWWDGCFFEGWNWEWSFKAKNITHWAELPSPPRGDNHEK
jgi:hypothetical protein